MNKNVITFIDDLNSDKFADDAIEKMFFNLAVVYKVGTDDYWEAFGAIMDKRMPLAINIKNNMKVKLDKAYLDRLTFKTRKT